MSCRGFHTRTGNDECSHCGNQLPPSLRPFNGFSTSMHESYLEWSYAVGICAAACDVSPCLCLRLKPTQSFQNLVRQQTPQYVPLPLIGRSQKLLLGGNGDDKNSKNLNNPRSSSRRRRILLLTKATLRLVQCTKTFF